MAPRPVTPMTILAATLGELEQRVHHFGSVDAGFVAQLQAASELAGGLETYVSQNTTPESATLRLIADRTQAEDWDRHSGGRPGPVLEQEMLSGHVEGQLLQFLVHLSRARRVLEIGMFTGYSALAMAEVLPADGEVVACEVDAYAADLAQRCFDESPDGKKITVRVAPAAETLRQLSAANETFDLVFIDADKAGYADYLAVLLESGLLRPDGLICVDNTLMQGLPYSSGQSTANSRAIASFNRAVADDPRVVQVLLPVRDGLTLIRRA